MPEHLYNWEPCFLCSWETRKVSGSQRKTIEIKQAFDKLSLEDYCRKGNISLERLLQTAWAIVIGAYAGTEDPCAAFISKETPRSIFRCQLKPGDRLRDILGSIEVRPLQVTSVGGEDCNGIVDNTTEAALFDTFLVLLDDKEAYKNLQVPLILQFCYSQNTILVNHDPGVISAQRSSSAAESLLATIHGLAKNDEQALCDLDILGDNDRRSIQAWNGEEIVCDQRCIHEVIREKAQTHPEKPAICSWNGENFTYQELDTLSDRLAGHLIQLGVGSDMIVPFLFHKSPWTVVAILSILKAGGAILGLNPEFPRDRLTHLIDVTSASVLLCGSDLVDFISHPSVNTVVVDRAFVSNLSSDSLHSKHPPSPTNIGLVVFTSGSTGSPKGTLLEHAGYCSAALAHHKSLNISPESRVLHFAAYSFDGSLLEILSTLIAGACICIPSEEQRWNDLAGIINELGVTWVGITPTLAKILVPSDVPLLQTMVLWGEAPTKDLVDIWADKLQLMNAWGPSECSVISSAKHFSEFSKDPLNLGVRTQANYLWVVRPDNFKLLAPIGSIGEAVVQGPIVGREYLNEEAKTAAAFIRGHSWRDSVPDTNPSRAYRSGDLVRLADDGSLEFLGRRDFQIKLRGQRVELGEVEHYLDTYAPNEIACAAEVIKPAHRSTQQILAAFFWPRESSVHHPGSASSILMPISDARRTEFEEIKSQLSRLVPPYMVPEVYISLACTPSSLSGKIDRKMLRELASKLSMEQMQKYSLLVDSEPLDTIKGGLLVDIMCGVLGIDATSIRKSATLFSLGADSISAMRIASAARSAGLSITPADILRQPKVSDLMALVDTSTTPEIPKYTPFISLDRLNRDRFLEDAVARSLGVPRNRIEDVAPATSYQASNIVTGLMKTRGGTNFLSLTFSNPVPSRQLRESCRKIVAHHAILRTVFVIHDRQLLQVSYKSLPPKISSHHFEDDIILATQNIIRRDTAKPMKLSEPIVKFILMHQSNDSTTQRLLLRISHGQYDGISLFRLLKDLRLAFMRENLTSIPSFAEYKYLANSNREMAENYWRELLSGGKITHVLQHIRPPYRNVLDGEVTRLIPTNSISSKLATIATVLKTAWSLVLMELSGGRDVIFGSTSWGRNAPYAAASEVVGPCMDHIPVRVRIKSKQTNCELLDLVQSQHAASLPFENIGFSQILERATPWHNWERLSSVILYQNLDGNADNFEIEDENAVVIDEIRPPADRADIAIFVTPFEKQTSISVNFCENIIGTAFATEMLDMLCGYAEALAQNPDRLANFPQTRSDHVARIPLAIEQHVDSANSSKANGHTSVVRGKRSGEDHLSEDSHPRKKKKTSSENEKGKRYDIYSDTNGNNSDHIRAIVSSAWQTVLSVSETEFEKQYETFAPYFNIWGSHIAAYGLAEFFQNAGWSDVIMEDVMENASAAEQVNLLGVKRHC